jgi:ABC-type transport system substrate-binding protein
VLKDGLAAGTTLATWPLYGPQALWSGEPGQPKRGGTLRVRGGDPPHFDPHLTINNYTNYLLSFTHGRLVRHRVGADVQPGTFIVEPDLAERWEEVDDTTYVFHLRRAISHAIDRQGLIDAVWVRGEPTAAVARGLVEWSLPVEQLGEGAKYYRYDPKEARRLLAEAGYPKGFKTQLTVTGGLSRDLIDDAQLVQRFLNDVGIEADLKIQEHGAYMATTMQGKFEGLVRSPFGIAWEPDAPLYRTYAADSSWNAAHLNDPTITAMLKEQPRTKDLAARKQIIHAIQRYAAEQQYYVYTNVIVITASWASYVKNYGPNHTFDYGSRAAALWLDR